jgi:hypothetical protein
MWPSRERAGDVRGMAILPLVCYAWLYAEWVGRVPSESTGVCVLPAVFGESAQVRRKCDFLLNIRTPLRAGSIPGVIRLFH